MAELQLGRSGQARNAVAAGGALMQLWPWLDYSLVALAQAAAVWLLWRSVGPGHGGGACSRCPSGTRTVPPALVQLPRRQPLPRSLGKPLVRR